MDPHDFDHPQMPLSPIEVGPSQHGAQPGELPYGFDAPSQGDPLAGISGALPMTGVFFGKQHMDTSPYTAENLAAFETLPNVTLAGNTSSFDTSMLPPQTNHRVNMPSFLISEHNVVAAMSANIAEKRWPCPQPDIFDMPSSGPPAVDQVMEDAGTMVKCPKCPKKKRRECDLRYVCPYSFFASTDRSPASI